jgi:N-acetylmuramoyl-L-alanine amidase
VLDHRVKRIIGFSKARGHLAWTALLLLLGVLTISGTATARAEAHLGNANSSAPQPDSVVPFGSTPVGANAVSKPNAPIVGMASTPNGRGYWMVGSDGGVFSYGDATFYGSEGGTHLNKPVVGMAATPNGGGYWLVAADGGVFSFGDAKFWGGTGNRVLNQPIVGIAPTPDGGGYWLVASDGGVFSFGNAKFWGSTGNRVLNKPVVGMAATSNGGGYWLVAADGGIFSFGDATFYGSAGASNPSASAVGMAAVPGDGGYWVVFGTAQPLGGKIVGIDPGHNGLNWTDTAYINQPIWNGQEYEACDTTGTATDGGYTEAQYNFNVATYLQRDLEAEGAQVVMTRTNNSGVGPCVTTRAAIINDAHANVAVDIHADGGPPGGRGFAVLEPVADGPNNAVITSSLQFAAIMRDDFLRTGMPISTYDGMDGLQPRNNLAGLNLTTVPKVLIECGNMRNATDAAMLVTPSFQQAAAATMAQAITAFLNG